jgi:hypothetical protein
MCPACVASAAWMIAGVMSVSGLKVAAAKLLPARSRSKIEMSETSKAKEK